MNACKLCFEIVFMTFRNTVSSSFQLIFQSKVHENRPSFVKNLLIPSMKYQQEYCVSVSAGRFSIVLGSGSWSDPRVLAWGIVRLFLCSGVKTFNLTFAIKLVAASCARSQSPRPPPQGFCPIVLSLIIFFWRKSIRRVDVCVSLFPTPKGQNITNKQTERNTTMAKFFCKYCGNSFPNVRTLTAFTCPHHPNGPGKGKHVLYQGGEKEEYTCEYCGQRFRNFHTLVTFTCPRHPDGPGKGKHSPAL